MGVMKEGLSAWPETVAYKRMLRNLARGQEYVPPQQPTGSGPLLEVEEARVSTVVAEGAGGDAQPEQATGTGSSQVGDWMLQQNTRGDLVAQHASGAEIVLAPNPRREDRG